MNISNLMTVKEIAEIVGWNPRTVSNRVSSGADMPPSIKVGNKRLFDKDAVYSWLRSHEEKTSVN